MGFFEASILNHAAGVLLLTWALSWFGRCHPSVYLLCFAYLYLVHERYIERLKRRVQSEEMKRASQRRLLSDAESLRWLNHAVEKIWPICMEQLASQRFLLPIIPWFLDKFKPWTAKEAIMNDLYLGRSPPMFTDIKVVHPATDDDHLVLDLGMSFIAADDVRAILAVKLRKRLGFGVWTRLHVTGIHVEGRVLVGVKFIGVWPFIGRLRLCFVEPPFFQATVKPVFSHGIDVTEIPGISGWVDKLMAAAFSEVLVEPNMLVVDVEKLVDSPQEKDWFTMDEKSSIAFARVVILEAVDMKPSDPNGLADPYVKGHIGPSQFQTSVRRKTLAPRWLEAFKIPITSWEAAILRLEVFDKDYIFDDFLGSCLVNLAELRGGQSHDLWLPLQEVKMGRLHLAVTIIEVGDGEVKVKEVSPVSGGDGRDVFEPVDVKGQEKKAGVWVHRPGHGCHSRKWELRRGKERRPTTELHGEAVQLSSSCDSPAGSSSLLSGEGSSSDGNGDEDESPQQSKSHCKTPRGLLKKWGIIAKSPLESPGEHQDPAAESEGDGVGVTKSNRRRDSAMGILKQVGNSAQNNLKKILSKKGSSKSKKSSDDGSTSDLQSPISPLPSTSVCPSAPDAPETLSVAESPTAAASAGASPPTGERVDDGHPPSRKVSFQRSDGTTL